MKKQINLLEQKCHFTPSTFLVLSPILQTNKINLTIRFSLHIDQLLFDITGRIYPHDFAS